jgi:hypothetical protein
MKTERFAMAYRLVPRYAFVRPESEQTSSHLQIDYDRDPWQSSFITFEVSAQADIDAAFQVLRSACRISDQRRRADRANSRRVMRCGSIEKSVVPRHRKFRPATPYANYKIDHAMIAGD